jgi:hypothetical protein
MKHGHISRNYAKAFFAFAALAMVGACAEKSTVAPAEQAAVINAPANFSLAGNAVVFRVDNAEGITKKIGAHVIYIPAGAICELTSSYGATEWDKPCNPLNGSVVITATVFQDDDAHPYIDFQPAMRFVPTKDVMLFFRQGHNSAKKQLVINYCNAIGYCYDESRTDASLKPFRVGNSPILGRRIKHFSGYNIGSGGDYCPGTIIDNGDGTYWCELDGFSRKSGYMVASGQDVAEVMNEKADKKDEQ